MPSVAVVTATTGRDTLKETIESVAKQTVDCRHYVFCDGIDWPYKILEEHSDIEWCRLPVKTGGNGIMNGGIIAASAFLVQEDYICWLDDDNWIEPEHVEYLLKAVEGKGYAYTLRKLVEADGSFFDYDDFESLGPWGDFIDLNCYLMDRRLAMMIAPNWYNTNGELMIGDRFIYQALKQNNIPFGMTGKYTVNYRLSPKRDLRAFFFNGNIQRRAQHSGNLPWRAQ